MQDTCHRSPWQLTIFSGSQRRQVKLVDEHRHGLEQQEDKGKANDGIEEEVEQVAEEDE